METNRTDKFVKNVIGSAILQLITVVTGFISPRLMLTAFGSEINGITTSITQFISYITLVEAGLSNATIFALYKPLADRDNKARDSVISAARISYYRIGYIFVALSIVLAAVYPFIGHTDALNYRELALLVLVLCCNSTMNFFILAKYRTLLTADQCGYVVSLASGAQLIAHLVLIWIGVKLGFGVVVVRGMGLASLLLTPLILVLYTRKRYPSINYKATPNMKALDKRWDAMVIQIMGVAFNGAPVIIMTAILDYKLISVYGIYNMISGSVSTCITVLTSGLSASFGNIYAIGDKELLKKTTDEFRTAFYILIAIVYSTMICTLMPFIALYTGDIHDVNYYLPVFGVLITLKGLLDNFKAPHGMLVFSFGKFKAVKRQNLIQTVLVVVLTFVLTKMYSIYGAMLSLCICNIYMLVALLIVTPRELVEMSIGNNVRQIVQVLAIVFGMYYFTTRFSYSPGNYFSWLIYACVIGVCAVAITVFVFSIFDRAEVSSLWSRVKMLLKKKDHFPG